MFWRLVLLLLPLLYTWTDSITGEGQALGAVRSLLNSSKNALSSWDSTLVDPCSWSHVTCDQSNHVTQVNLEDQGLSGNLSPSIGNLPSLQTLKLNNNSFSGSLPNELGKLSKLQTFDASNNAFIGNIPSTLGQILRLEYLILSYNRLSGDIPAALASISGLLNLDLSYNELTGQIPDFAFKIPQYNFAGNQLSCGSTNGSICNLSRSEPPSSPSTGRSSKKSNVGAIIGGIVGGVTFLAVTYIFFIWSRNQYRLRGDAFVDVPAEDDLKIALGQLRRFSWRELQIATENFSDENVLGQGGFGKVYKGILGDGTQIAVKRLKDYNVQGGETAFLQELGVISVAAHRNILHLIGFCSTPLERLLVYPFMVNNSVAYHLRERKLGESRLDWQTRKRIALGAARGLAYLHDHCNPKIIHRDVKAANVLLNEHFEAVVGDFGLAKLVDTRNTHVTTMVRGTMGHIAPEYLSTGKSSEKTDVFGYGIMLLELVTGQRAIDFSRLQEEDGVLLLDHVKKLQHEERLDLIVDPSLQQYNPEEIEGFIRVALLCTQPTPEDRPKMAEVVGMLVGEGLPERWEEWQQVEVVRRQQYEMMPHRLTDWVQDSTVNQEAIELSTGR